MSLVAQNLPFDQCISFDRDDSIANDDISDDALCNLTVFRLRFASWVAGRKLGGPGAQGALPSAKDVDECLGVTYASVTGRLTMRPKGKIWSKYTLHVKNRCEFACSNLYYFILLHF